MTEKALERVLHYKCPEWNNSIRSARSEADFSFDLLDRELWGWLVSGGHEKVKEITDRETRNLGVEQFFEYYLCCFYSDYEQPSGTIDFEMIKGPPWVELECPAIRFGEDWRRSIQNAREDIDRRLGHSSELANGKISGEFLSWYFERDGAYEVTKLAKNEVERLGMEPVNSLLWVCCLAPIEVYRMVDRSRLIYDRFSQLIDWDHFRLKCPNREFRRRVRAYPGVIDWSEGLSPPEDFPVLPARPGIHYQIVRDSSSRLTLNVSWDPMIVTSEKELAAATRDLRRYYKLAHRPYVVGNTPSILERLTQQKRKGGRPKWGAVQDKIALECARLKKKGSTVTQVANEFGFPVQEDSYGKPTQSSTARRYIKRGMHLCRLKRNNQP